MEKKFSVKPKKTNKKKLDKSNALSVYSNLAKQRNGKKKAAHNKKRAEYLASLPKDPWKRFLYRMHPQRFWGYWFSKQGALMLLKIAGIFILFVALVIGGLFAYFRKDLDQIRPDELAKRVQSTTTKYFDRNGILLWEDKGVGNYKLTVESDEIADNIKKATVAMEDRDFYTHGGVSIQGTLRAVINNFAGGQTQGGSTLTQQLVKQVFFAEEAENRGLGGIPRKIKEAILAIEVERTYSKDQILTLYLNESPYGGRRNGVESGAQTYFGKSAKDLNLAESALLAAIPQNPSVYDPYNVAGHDGLIARQHAVLNAMVEVGYITKEDAETAKKYPILDHILPQTDQYAGIKAPHFVQMVRSQLEDELGATVVGRGGLNVTTTLDYRVQQKLEEAMNDMFNSYVPGSAGFTNGAATVEDTQTGQIIALMGSRDFQYPGYGQDNAAEAFIQPGSTIKPLVYAQLFQKKATGQANWGSGSILVDENIDAIYGAPLFNADRRFGGALTIRHSLATSRNVPAVKAMYISGVQPTLQTIRSMGATSYCTQGVDAQAQLSAAIGGCGLRQVDLVNAYASLGREGIYKPQSTILEVKNNAGETLKKWTDTTGEQIVDKQAAYIVTDILHDDVARQPLVGYHQTGMWIPGVDTATKTGTSDKGGQAKDIWMVSYSPAITMAVWLGNPDTTPLRNGSSIIPGPIIAKVSEYAHKEVYGKDGRWKSGDWYTRPAGIQQIGNELYPSYWNKTQGQANATLDFDRVSKKKATACTPPGAKISVDVIKFTDPVTKKDSYSNVPGGYDATKEDDVHKCNGDYNNPTNSVPSLSNVNVDTTGETSTVTVRVTGGTPSLTVELSVNGQTYKMTPDGGNIWKSTGITGTVTSGTITVTDSLYYTSSINL